MFLFFFILLVGAQPMIKSVRQADKSTVKESVAIITHAQQVEFFGSFVFQQLSVVTPEKMSLIEFKKEGYRYTISGLAANNSEIHRLLVALENNEYFEEVFLSEIEEQEWKTQKVKFFSLKFLSVYPRICMPSDRMNISEQRRFIVDSLEMTLNASSLSQNASELASLAKQNNLQIQEQALGAVNYYSKAIAGTPIDVTVQGTYGDISKYLYQIASEPTLTSVQDFTITKIPKSSNKLRLTVSIVLMHPIFNGISPPSFVSPIATASCPDAGKQDALASSFQIQGDYGLDPFYSFDQQVQQVLDSKQPLERYPLSELCVSSDVVQELYSISIRSPEEEVAALVGQSIGSNSGQIQRIEMVYRVVVIEEKTISSGETVSNIKYVYPCKEN